MTVTDVNGNTKEFPKGTTFIDALTALRKDLIEEALVASVDGVLYDLSHTIPGNITVEFITFDDERGKKIYWHSTAHVMASAVKHLFPQAKVTIGPAIDEGFYYDFDVEKPFTEEDLSNIEEEMKRIISQNSVFSRKETSKEEACKLFSTRGESYKVELAEDIDDDILTLYTLGDFVDLCRGPHIPAANHIKAFKLLSTAGAYWRGDERNRMLQRIYGISFPNEAMLKAHLEWLEEVKKRDHRILGAKLDLYSVDDEIGSGLILWHPKGAMVRGIIEDYWREEHRKRGYHLVFTPHIASERIYRRSGHLENYVENMYSPMDIDGVPYYVKPMNCPGHIKIFQSQLRSYRDLPMRLCELGTVYRYERSGVLHGMLRVRGFTQDDSHIFCTPEQVVGEVIDVLEFVTELMKVFGYDYRVFLSTRPEKFLGDDTSWEVSTSALREALEKVGVPFTIEPGEGVFYGPKVDIKLKDVLGRLWQGPTIQVDLNLANRFNINYIGTDGSEHRVVMIHRVVLGSMERFIGGLIEHYAGAFPVWLSPVQVVVMPITDAQHDYARKLTETMRERGIRVDLDSRNEKVNRKIRDAEELKIPYMFIIGKREVEGETVSVRKRGKGDSGAILQMDIIEQILSEIREKTKE